MGHGPRTRSIHVDEQHRRHGTGHHEHPARRHADATTAGEPGCQAYSPQPDDNYGEPL
jgi:hypothetical protein